MSGVRTVTTIAAAWQLCAAVSLTAQEPPRGFPHEKHQTLFPVCEGCHADVTSGDRRRLFPAASDCARCHDGQREVRVAWQGATPRVSNLRFSHAEHLQATEARGESATCQECHATTGATARMQVAAPNPVRCLRCHAHAAPSHPARTTECAQCHLPLARATTLSADRVARVPRPAWHDSADYASGHGTDAVARPSTCATCHARESCERCHANAGRVPVIAGLSRDARVAALVRGKAPRYPEPASHEGRAWATAHGGDARKAPATCANCHVQPGCIGCHREAAGTSKVAIGRLPTVPAGSGLGVAASRMSRPVHPGEIGTQHGRLAATGALDCAQCHSTRTCTACHAAAESRAFHAANFVERHAVEVFGSRNDCQSCHNTERFCRACHAGTGIASRGTMNAAFHTAKPMWVLSHGQAARMGMEACASCHRQNDCVRCHSAAGGWGVNPHGRGYPSGAVSARNASSCRWCHLAAPGRP